MTEVYRVRLKTLRVVDQQESSGDEPYLVVIGFRSRFLTPGSTSVFWNGPLFKLADNAKSGAKLSIPRDMGEVTFTNVERLTRKEISGGKLPEILGQIVITFESDATPFSDIRELVNKAKDAISGQLRTLIEQGRLDPDDPERSLREAIRQIQDTMMPSVGEIIRLFVRSWSDPDDIIGISPLVWASVDNEFAQLTNIPRLRSGTFNLEFKGDGANYAIDGAVVKAGSIRSSLLSHGHPANSSIRAVMRPEYSVRRWLET